MKKFLAFAFLSCLAITGSSHAQDGRSPLNYASSVGPPGPTYRFEISGSLLFLQPSAGNLEYATLVSPLPLPTPNWQNQSLDPDLAAAFRFGLRYIPTPSTDFQLHWTRLNTSANAAVAGSGSQMVGPPFEIGPTASVYQKARGSVDFAFDSVNLDVGHTFCTSCAFQLRVFGGVEFARINQNLTGTFESNDGLNTASNTTHSSFSGAGPRVGVRGQYAVGSLQFFGEGAVAALIGTTQTRINFSATSTALPGLAQPNNQALTSPDETQVVPSFDVRVGTAYVFPPSYYGQLRIELGYQAAMHMNASNQYALTQVSIPPAPASVGVFLATAEHLQSNFTTHGPFLIAVWAF